MASQRHPVGGVGTPWRLKHVHTYIEVACFATGCNFRCPQCQNWDITYNEKLISLDEIGLIGMKLYEINPKIQVCALDYRPEFERLDLQKPSYDDMVEVHNVLKAAGLKTVICQTDRGHIGP